MRWKGALWLGPELDLYYMRNRWYEPPTGRFLSEDPIGLAGGINPLIFAGGDPVTGRDPEGLNPCENGNPAYQWSLLANDDGSVTVTCQLKEVQVTAKGGGIFRSGFSDNFGKRGGSFGGFTAGGLGGQGGGSTKAGRLAEDSERVCRGSARVLQGNARTIGRPGGFSGGTAGVIPVTAGSAAIIPSQWGGNKALLRSLRQNIRGTFPEVAASFNGISDIVGGQSPIPGMNVRDALMKMHPGVLILELPSGERDFGVTAFELIIPDGLACPQGTSSGGP